MGDEGESVLFERRTGRREGVGLRRGKRLGEYGAVQLERPYFDDGFGESI